RPALRVRPRPPVGPDPRQADGLRAGPGHRGRAGAGHGRVGRGRVTVARHGRHQDGGALQQLRPRPPGERQRVVVVRGRVVVVVAGKEGGGEVVVVDGGTVVGGGGTAQGGTSSGNEPVTGVPSAAVPDTSTLSGLVPPCWQVISQEARPAPVVVVGLGVPTVHAPGPVSWTVAVMGAVRTTPRSSTVRVPRVTTRLAGLSTSGGLGAMEDATAGPV